MSRIEQGRVYAVRAGDEARWRALAEYAVELGTGRARGLQRLRDLRDAVNSAVVIGPDGEGNVCRCLLGVVNQRCDPRAADPLGDELQRLGLEVLARCDSWKAVEKAGRSAR